MHNSGVSWINSSLTWIISAGVIGSPSRPASLVPSNSFTKIRRCCGLFWNLTTYYSSDSSPVQRIRWDCAPPRIRRICSNAYRITYYPSSSYYLRQALPLPVFPFCLTAHSPFGIALRHPLRSILNSRRSQKERTPACPWSPGPHHYYSIIRSASGCLSNAACPSSSRPFSSQPSSASRPSSSQPFSSAWLSWPFSWDPSSLASLQPAWEPPVSQRERAPSPALLRRSSALPPRSPPLRRRRVRRLLPALTARCRLRNYLSRGPFHPPLGESSPMFWGRVLCGRSKCALQCLRRCYRTRRELSSILLSRTTREVHFQGRGFVYGSRGQWDSSHG